MEKIYSHIDDSESKILGRNIKSYRERTGLDQKGLSIYLEVSEEMINSFEDGIAEPNIIHLNKLSILFQIDISDLVEDNNGILAENSLVAFRKESLDYSDINAIADFRKIVRNYIKMTTNDKAC